MHRAAWLNIIKNVHICMKFIIFFLTQLRQTVEILFFEIRTVGVLWEQVQLIEIY